jgi:hypothetical protein
MSYDTTRDSEQLDVIDHAIDDFINRYNNSSGSQWPAPDDLFPGGGVYAQARNQGLR